MVDEKTKNVLTDEQCEQYLYFLAHFDKEKFKNIINKKFVCLINDKIDEYLNIISKNKDIRIETINLLIQAHSTLKNVNTFIYKKEVVDANSLLRSAFENIIMGMIINNNEETYKEFINLSINEETRKFTKQQKLRNEFRKVLKNIKTDVFNEINSRKVGDMLNEYYDKLCLFTHSTLIVNAIAELNKNNCISLYVFALKINYYFLLIVYYLCLRMLTKYYDSEIDFNYAWMGIFVLMSDINKEELTEENVNRLKSILYFEINKKYVENSRNEIEGLKREMDELNKEIESNPLIIAQILQKVMDEDEK